jgi:pimeloyl-ACP methyl ester carboxylesterase
MFKKIGYCLLLIVLAGCSGHIEPTALVATLPPQQVAVNPVGLPDQFIKEDCQFQGRGGGTQDNAVCGSIRVPEDHNKPEGAKIKLELVVLHTQSASPKTDPVLMLTFGPSPEVNISPFYTFQFGNISQDRDIIAIDQRGVGRSQPAFTCDELSDAYMKNLDSTPYSSENEDVLVKAMQACYQTWAASGASLAAYSSAETEKDIEDVRQTFGFQQWNIYASGYGAQIALLLMRDYPQTIRSVVIDSLEPISAEEYAGQVSNEERVLDVFFQSCAGDKVCGKAFPDLKRTFFELIDQLNAEPALVSVADLNTGDHYKVLVDGNRMVDLALAAFSGRDMTLQEMPRTIYQMRSKKYDNLAKLIPNMIQATSLSSVGMEWRITCGEVFSRVPKEQMLKAIGAADTHLTDYFTQRYALTEKLCSVWNSSSKITRADWPQINASSIPVLLMVGDRNPSSDPAWTQKAAGILSRSFMVEITGKGSPGGFDRGSSNCQRLIVSAFFADPQTKPDSACAAQQPTITWITLP